MRALIAGAVVALFISPSTAQDIRQCPDDVLIVGPGSFVPSGAVPGFRWTAEPASTASREIVVFPADNPDKPQVGKVDAFGGGLQLAEGEYGWFVTFKNAAGAPICRTAVAALTIGGETRYAGGGSLSGATSGDPLKITLNAAGRYVIVLRNSRYTGAYTAKIDSNNFDGSAFALGSGIGLEIHGNELLNIVIGSPGSDLIVLYDGNDDANGGAGNDTMHGGRGVDQLTDTQGLDAVYGGPDGDFINTDDTIDDNDTVYGGSGADTITADAAEVDSGDGDEGIF